LTGGELLLNESIPPSSFGYVVFNQEFSTFTIPNAAQIGGAVRSLTKRRLP